MWLCGSALVYRAEAALGSAASAGWKELMPVAASASSAVRACPRPVKVLVQRRLPESAYVHQGHPLCQSAWQRFNIISHPPVPAPSATHERRYCFNGDSIARWSVFQSGFWYLSNAKFSMLADAWCLPAFGHECAVGPIGAAGPGWTVWPTAYNPSADFSAVAPTICKTLLSPQHLLRSPSGTFLLQCLRLATFKGCCPATQLAGWLPKRNVQDSPEHYHGSGGVWAVVGVTPPTPWVLLMEGRPCLKRRRRPHPQFPWYIRMFGIQCSIQDSQDSEPGEPREHL